MVVGTIELGYVTAYVGVALANKELTVEAGATLEVPGFEGLEIIESDDGGYILYLNKLNPFTADTVDAWIDIL